MGTIEDIRSGKIKVENPVDIPIAKGMIWLNMLLEYDLRGNVKILRSFTRPAKESTIKMLQRDKKVVEKFVVKDEIKEERLF